MKNYNKIIVFFCIFVLLLFFHTAVVYAEQLVLKQGMSGDDMLKLQIKLQEAGYYHGALDGNFGPLTCSAVINFQKDNGLAVDGIVGPGTLQALKGSINTVSDRGGVLKQGMSGDEVLQMQIKLQGYGYYFGSLDGDFGPGTRNALMKFQVDNALEVDGIAGPETVQALQNFRSIAPLPNRGTAEERQAQAIVSFAKQFLSTPYAWGGSSPSGFDCSGFTYYVFSQHGIYLAHAADEQFKCGIKVNPPKAGDLVFFTTYRAGPSHVGIYIGNDQFIHASSANGGVCINQLSSNYYSARYLGARRFIN